MSIKPYSTGWFEIANDYFYELCKILRKEVTKWQDHLV